MPASITRQHVDSPDIQRVALWSGDVRFMVSPPRDAASNMALDEAMLETAADGGQTLVRLYSWTTPSVSFGRIRRTPKVGKPDEEGCRRVRIPGFPFSIVYREEKSEIVVYAVRPDAREPGYWWSRAP